MNRMRRGLFSTGWAVLLAVLILLIRPAMAQQTSYVRTSIMPNKANIPCVEERGLIQLTVQGNTQQKRYVLRYPEERAQWNNKLVIGAHGGTGGVAYNRTGQATGTNEVALDDVIGQYALNASYAYASVDRDGIGGTREGLALTYEFTRLIRERLKAVYGRDAAQTSLVGFSMGGAIARYAAEDTPPKYDGVLIIAGGAGDTTPQFERQARLAVLWPDIDPRKNPNVTDSDPKVKAYAKLIGTPVSARSFWPFVGSGASLDDLKRSLEWMGLTGLTEDQLKQFRAADYRKNATFMANVAKENAANPTGKVGIPTIEVVGTYDDIVLQGVLAYKEKVRKASASAKKPTSADLHRLYQVEGVWHISRDDDAIPTFQYLMRQMGYSEEIQDKLRDGGS